MRGVEGRRVDPRERKDRRNEGTQHRLHNIIYTRGLISRLAPYLANTSRSPRRGSAGGGVAAGDAREGDRKKERLTTRVVPHKGGVKEESATITNTVAITGCVLFPHGNSIFFSRLFLLRSFFLSSLPLFPYLSLSVFYVNRTTWW